MLMFFKRLIQIMGAYMAGFFGVMFGLGGGIILVPVLLFTGVKPKETIEKPSRKKLARRLINIPSCPPLMVF